MTENQGEIADSIKRERERMEGFVRKAFPNATDAEIDEKMNPGRAPAVDGGQDEK